MSTNAVAQRAPNLFEGHAQKNAQLLNSWSLTS
jgi:hypothetical protein